MGLDDDMTSLIGEHDGIGVSLIEVGSGGGPRRTDAAARIQRGEIGSLTKPITAIGLAVAVRERLCSLDDPLERWIAVPDPAPSWVRAVTLGQVASHTARLPRLPPGLLEQIQDERNPWADFSAEDTLASLGSLPEEPDTDVGTYSNYGFMLLGIAIANATGSDYESFISKRVLQPLGLHGTTFDAEVTQGYHDDFTPMPAWTGIGVRPAGGLRASPSDLAALLRAMLTPPQELLEPIALTLREVHPGRGMAWQLADRAFGRVIWHNGGTYGYHTILAFTPTGHGVVAITNCTALGRPLEQLAMKRLTALAS